LKSWPQKTRNPFYSGFEYILLLIIHGESKQVETNKRPKTESHVAKTFKNNLEKKIFNAD
jgi:hypothetical protein